MNGLAVFLLATLRRGMVRPVIASSSEVEHHLGVVSDLGLVDEAITGRLLARCVEVRRMLHGLHKALLKAEENSRAS